MDDLTGINALVTGGSRGIGRAIVEGLAARGASVVFSYVTDERSAADVVRSATARGATVSAIRADMADPDAVRTLVRGAVDHLDGLDVLVNNAAIVPSPTPMSQMTDAQFDEVMAVNARGVFVAMREAILRMRDGGCIVNISSVNTVIPAPGVAAYAASKAAVEQLTAVAARELGSRGITVNTVSPGATDTDALRSGHTRASLAAVAEMTPLGRLGSPRDVAGVVLFLVGPDGRWLTGQNVHAAGGLA